MRPLFRYLLSGSAVFLLHFLRLSENLKRIRLEKGLTQQVLANALDVTRSAVAAYENGRIEPSIEKLLILSAMLQVSLDDLMR